MARPDLPNPPTEESLRVAMRDQRYWRAGHPDRADWAAAVTAGWQRLHEAETARPGDGVVHVRAYSRNVDGRPQQVGPHRRSAPEGGSEARRWEKSYAPVRAEKDEKPLPQPQPVVIFIGGLLDGQTGVVRRPREAFGAEYRNLRTEYFSHDQRTSIHRLIDSLPAGTPLRIVGHSWGGDTAAQVAATLGDEGRRVQKLITIDPVGRGTSEAFYERVRRGASEWVNINAAGGRPSDIANLVATVGSPYGQGPRRFATHFIDAPHGHAAFNELLRSTLPGGRSARDLAAGFGPWK